MKPFTGKPKMSPEKMEKSVVPPVDDMEEGAEEMSPVEKIKSMCSTLTPEEKMELCEYLQEENDTPSDVEVEQEENAE